MAGLLVGCPWIPDNVSDPGDEAPGDDDSVDSPLTCEYPDVPSSDPEGNDTLAGVTARHNYWRARVGVDTLQWNETLAAEAQAHADKGVFEYDSNRNSTSSGFSHVGENIYFESPGATATEAVDEWAGERSTYDFGTTIETSPQPEFLPYTQVVWDDTTDVGCGYYQGEVEFSDGSTLDGTFIVCRYGPAGNWGGETPYDFTDAPCVDLDNDDTVQKDDSDDTDRTVQ